MSPTVYVMGGLTVAVAVMYFGWTYQVREVRAQRDAAIATVDLAIGQVNQANAVNEANLAALEAVKADVAAAQAARQKAEADAHKRSVALNNALKRIANAPTSDDGPVAPVLRDQLLDLSGRVLVVEPSNPAANRPNENPSGTPGSAEPIMPTTTPATGP
jgi:hypothetical protein